MIGLRLRVVVDGVSPLIVRTLEAPAALTLSELNRVLLECFGWSGECLHVFEIRARCYSDRWLVEAQSSLDVTVGSLGLRVGERFCWRYDFTAGWIINCRVEALIDDPAAVACVDGRRESPAEWCRGPADFYRWEDLFSVLDLFDALADLLADDDQHDVEEVSCRLREVSRWLLRDRFDKTDLHGRLSMLEFPSCVLLSRSA